MKNKDQTNPVRRVYLMAPEFSAIDGVAEQVVTLATELARRDLDTWVFIRRPSASDNQYLHRLGTVGVPVVCPPRLLAFLGRIDWAARDQILGRVVWMGSLLLILPIAVDAIIRGYSFERSLRRARGYLNRILSKVLLPDYLDHIFHLQLAWHVWRHRPDVVEISRSDYVWQVNWFYRRNLPTVYKEHGTTYKRTPMQIQSLRRATCLIAVSESAASALHQSADTQQAIYVIPNAVDVWSSHIGNQRGEPFPDIDSGDRVVCVSRLCEEKGVQLLPEVARGVIDEIPDARFLIAGEGPLRQQLEQDRTRLSLDDKFHLLGALDRWQVLELLRNSDVFLLPSLTEGMPVSVIEAMACGKAIVATAVGGTPELITDGVSGLLVHPLNPSALAQALIKVLQDGVLRKRLEETAKSIYEQGPWTPKSAADATLKVYRYAHDGLANHEKCALQQAESIGR